MGVAVDEARDEDPSPAGDHGIPASGGRGALAYRGDAVVVEDDVSVLDRRGPLGRDDGDVADENPVRRRGRLEQGRGEEGEEHGMGRTGGGAGRSRRRKAGSGAVAPTAICRAAARM